MWGLEDALKYLDDTAPPGKSEYGLGRINHLLELLDHPESGYTCVTVVGTNGKGSTIAFLDSLLREHGLTVACHIKPHLEKVTERIRIDGRDSTPDEFASALWEVKKAVDDAWSREDRATYFELIFAAFLCAARTAGVELVLLETGLGGRLDAVNSVDADMVVLTSIGFDHTELLGDTLREITREKIGVVRDGGILVVQVNPSEVMEVVNELKHERDVRVFYNSEDVSGIKLGLDGPFQELNASLALRALKILAREIIPRRFKGELDRKSIMRGFGSARLPGRWEKICADGDRTWIIDGAHNVSGLTGVLDKFRSEYDRSGTIIFGMKVTKNAGEVIPILLRSASRLIFVKVPFLESWDPVKLAGIAGTILNDNDNLSQIQVDCAENISEGIDRAESGESRGGATLITGSLYLAGEARAILKYIPAREK